MTPLGRLFSSSARTEVLRVLHHQSQPIGLRQLAMLAGIHPHSAERVLQALTHDHHVTLRKSKYRLQITKRVDHPDWRILAAIFDAAETMRLDEDRKALNRRAQQLLPFIALVTGMVKRARRKRRVA